MKFFVHDELERLEKIRNSRVIVYFGDDRSGFSKSIDDEDLPILHQCLRELGHVDRLDVVIHTSGGYVNASRRICLLLRSYSMGFNVLIPYKARSAGTMLCLGANQIIMNPMAELGPIDPRIGTEGNAAPGMPLVISSEDIRAFRQVAESWFGLQSEEHRMQIFNILSQRIFPTSISSFFRADQQVRCIANELLQYQLPDADPETHQYIVNQLVSGYHTHDYSITCSEAQSLGLQVRRTSAAEEDLLTEIWRSCDEYTRTPMSGEAKQPTHYESVNGIITSTNFIARYVARGVEYLPINETQNINHEKKTRLTRTLMDSRWEIINPNR